MRKHSCPACNALKNGIKSRRAFEHVGCNFDNKTTTMATNITPDCRVALITALESILDTREKRYMFLRMEFKELLPGIDLEGSSRNTAWNIYDEFRKQSMLSSLVAHLNKKLDAGIVFQSAL